MSGLPEGWRDIPFSEAAVPVSDQGCRLKQSAYQSIGAFPVIDQGQIVPGGWTDRADLVFTTPLPVIAFGDHTRTVRVINQPFVVGAEGLKLFLARVHDSRFICLWLTQASIPNRGYSRHAQFLKSLCVPLPPLAEQRRIVAEIEKQFTRLEQGNQSLQRLQKQVKKLLKAGIRAACSGLDERRTRRFETIVESMRNGISTKPTGNAGVEILKISAVRPFQVRFEERRFLAPDDAYAPFHLNDGDLLFTRYNGSREFVGVCAHVYGLQREFLYPDKLIRVRLKEGHEPRFYELMFNVGSARAHVASRIRTTAGQSGISAADLKSAPIPIASLEEQRVIVEEAERILSEVEHLACEVVSARSKASRLRQAILAKAFSGQLVPQDPNDEPASVLLERIRKERAITAKKPTRRNRASAQEELTLQS